MHPRKIARDDNHCSGGTCPAVSDVSDILPGDLAVQGRQADAALLAQLAELPPRAADETVVLISRALVKQALYPSEPVDLATLMAEFDTFSYSAVRVEQYQHYAGTGPDLQWAALVRRNRHWGKTHQRVHFVTDPLTDAMQQELTEGYEANAAAGEEIFVYPVTEGGWPDDMPRFDSWLFDFSRLYEMNYHPDGTFAGAVRITDPERIVEACRVQVAVVHRAIPWRTYIAGRPELQHRLAQ